MKLDISRRMALLIIFLGLLLMKYYGFNEILDDAIMLVIGAIIGVDVLSGKIRGKETRSTS